MAGRLRKRGIAANRLLPLAVCSVAAVWGAGNLGPFESSGDVGVTPVKGKVEFDGAAEYRVTGGGANMWAGADAFQFVWKKMSGDMALTADVHFLGAGTVAHRKAALMIRQSLDADSAYADAALHGDGLTSLQYRPTAAAMTLETQQPAKSDLGAPVHIRIERRGDRFTMLAGKAGEPLTTTGPAMVALHDPVYVGLAVCSHDANVLETAVFANVSVQALPARTPPPNYRSKISIYDFRDKSIRTVYQAEQIFEAPNWSPDGKYLLTNARGRLFRIAVDGSGSVEPEPVNIDQSLRLNNDHAPSPDGRRIAFSASSPASRQSQVYLADADGSNAHVMVTTTPSYFHGWSPDGKYLAYVYQHPAANLPANYDIFRIPAAGGQAEQLDSNPGYDDGPDYSPDGKWIYFNSDRSGGWDVWRIPANGAGPGDQKAEQVTSDEMEDWFPHPSPDGKWLLFLSFPKGTATHNDKMAGVQLRMMPMPGARVSRSPKIQVVTTFFGGQGTVNVNSWSPDSTRFAYVIYEPMQRAQTAVPDWALPGSATHKQVPPPADFHRPSQNFNTPIGVFDGQCDIGSAVVPGGGSYDPATKQYTINSAGYNIWYSRDEFRYLWKKMSGDVSLAADVTFPNPNGYGDRKAVLVIRQNLDDDSKEAMIGEHGVGMIHLAERPERSANLKDMQYRFGGMLANVKAKRIGIEKRGDSIAIFVSLQGEPMQQLGPPVSLHFDEPFYVGIGFCSHLPDKSDTAVLSDVLLENSAGKVH